MAIFPAQLPSYSIAGSGSSIGDATLILRSMEDTDGVAVAMTSLGSICYGTIEPNTDREEQISFTGITQNANGTATLTGVKSVVNLTPYTATAGLIKAHSGGTIFVVSNTSGFYNDYVNGQLPAICVCATIGAITIATDLNPGDVIDGVTLVAGYNVLVKNQVDQTENGIYVCSATPARLGSYNSDLAIRGSFISVTQGTTNKATQWKNTNGTSITIGATNITYAQNLISIPLTTKGDLIAYDVGVTRLGVGVDGQVLVADSASGVGFKWSALAGAGDVLGPATNTDSYVPQWDGADSKTLKNGLAVGTAANNLVQLTAAAKLPAVDGSLLTNLPASGGYTYTPIAAGITNIAVTSGEVVYEIDSSGGVVTINLPTAVANTAKYNFKVTNATNTITVVANGAEKIFSTSQVASITIALGVSYTMVSSGSQFLII